MKILTISIAAYNVEKFLREALDSICESNVLDDIEVIVVDDGSKDKTGLIGKEYEKKYPFSVKCIIKKNGGHGSTINVGLKNATGKYFRVLDGDDWVDSQGLSNFVKKLKTINSDIIVSRTKVVYPDYQESVTFDYLKEGKEYQITPDYPYDICALSTMTVKTDLIKNKGIHITENSFYVDLEFVIYSILCSRNFNYINENVYMYRRGMDEQSVNKKVMIKNLKMLENVNKNLFTIVDSYSSTQKIKRFALKRLINSTGALYRIYFLLEDIGECKKKIDEFETYLKINHREDYRYLSKDIFIKSIRFMKGIFIPSIRFIYIKRCRKKGLI